VRPFFFFSRTYFRRTGAILSASFTCSKTIPPLGFIYELVQLHWVIQRGPSSSPFAFYLEAGGDFCQARGPGFSHQSTLARYIEARDLWAVSYVGRSILEGLGRISILLPILPVTVMTVLEGEASLMAAPYREGEDSGQKGAAPLRLVSCVRAHLNA